MENNILDEDFNFGNQQNSFDKETIKNINLTKINLNEAISHLRFGRGACIALIVFTTFGLVMTLVNSSDEDLRLGMMFQSGLTYLIYLSCIFGLRYNAKAAMIVAFTFYALLIILDGVFDPNSLFRGLLMKGFFLFFLGRAIAAAFKVDQLTQKLSTLGVTSTELALIKQLKDLPRTEHRSEGRTNVAAPDKKED